VALTHYILKLSTKIIKPKSKTSGFPKSEDDNQRMTIKMQNGTLLKENNRRKNWNFLLKPT
jgi:hypothetical protein